MMALLMLLQAAGQRAQALHDPAAGPALTSDLGGQGWLDTRRSGDPTKCPPCLSSHLQWGQAIIPECGAASSEQGCPAGGGYNTTMALYFKVAAVECRASLNPPKFNPRGGQVLNAAAAQRVPAKGGGACVQAGRQAQVRRTGTQRVACHSRAVSRPPFGPLHRGAWASGRLALHVPVQCYPRVPRLRARRRSGFRN